MEKSEKEICLANNLDAVILVPKNTEGFFASLGIKSHLKKQGLMNFAVIEICPCQLDEVNKLNFNLNHPAIYIAGLGKRNCSSKALLNFIMKFGDLIAFWADNHPDSSYIEKMRKDKRYFHTSYEKHQSSLSFLKEIWGPTTIKSDWVSAANFFETKVGEKNSIAETYEKLMYVSRIEDCGNKKGTREQVLALYAEFLLDKKSGKEINFLIDQHDKIKKETKKAIENLHWWTETPNKILLCKAEGQVDKNLLSTAASKLANQNMTSHHLLIIQHADLAGDPITTMVGTRSDDIPASYQKNKVCPETTISVKGSHRDVLQDIYKNVAPGIQQKIAENLNARA